MSGLKIGVDWLFGGAATAWLLEGILEIFDAESKDRLLILGTAIAMAETAWLVGQVITLLVDMTRRLIR